MLAPPLTFLFWWKWAFLQGKQKCAEEGRCKLQFPFFLHLIGLYLWPWTWQRPGRRLRRGELPLLPQLVPVPTAAMQSQGHCWSFFQLGDGGGAQAHILHDRPIPNSGVLPRGPLSTITELAKKDFLSPRDRRVVVDSRCCWSFQNRVETLAGNDCYFIFSRFMMVLDLHCVQKALICISCCAIPII